MSRQRRRDSSSSILTVCGVQMKDIPGEKTAEEELFKNCLENKNGNNISGYGKVAVVSYGKYLMLAQAKGSAETYAMKYILSFS
ncbi:8410_t:CDS:2 [Paraglomus brasilianum]|uniref:8410_t:CDS:1 n=1 Tax=Paraglomus brasilianum TaxID=144538 RepID=A0A9N9GER7_9GLOM|nr:8410_t:CDS:2 [Paraglomus brasilianum]